MSIAILAWGSLIWCPGSLRIRTRWRHDGPNLPIEFARKSCDGRLTLVIDPRFEEQGTYWAVSDFVTLDDARRNLSEREGTDEIHIHHLDRLGTGPAEIPAVVKARVREWLTARREFHFAVWTGLPMKGPSGSFTTDSAVKYLAGLEKSGDRPTARRAREYVCNAPPQVNTEVREEMRKLGWRDVELPSILFDDPHGSAP